jgi:RNA polymerase primary sigma factor
MSALDHFDPERDCVFRSSAAYWILQAITRCIAMRGRLIRIPVYMLDRLARIRTSATSGEPQDGALPFRPPNQLPNPNDTESSPLSQPAETQLFDIEDVPEAELYQAAAADQPAAEQAGEDDSDLHRLHEVVHRVLDTLDPRERDVLTLRFGLNGCQAETLEQIGARYTLTRQRIRQIEQTALKKLRHPCRAETLMKI